jgi:hypothetical protein
LASICFALKDI